jgi:hypothetical protein
MFLSLPAKPGKAVFLPSEILIFWATHDEKEKKRHSHMVKTGRFL